jgi:hypothetical protein
MMQLIAADTVEAAGAGMATQTSASVPVSPASKMHRSGSVVMDLLLQAELLACLIIQNQ